MATALLMIAIVLAGAVGFPLLPLAALPQVDFPTIQVTTGYPGASPDVMAATVTAPLERQFGQMEGLKRLSSVSSAGSSVETLQFDLGLPLDVAEQEVQAAINAATTLLPADLPAPPVYAKVNPADAPVLTLAITSRTRPLTEVQNIVDSAARGQDRAGRRRRAGVAVGRRAAGGADPGEHPAAGELRHRLRHAAHRDRRRQRQRREGQLRRARRRRSRSTPTTS